MDAEGGSSANVGGVRALAWELWSGLPRALADAGLLGSEQASLCTEAPCWGQGALATRFWTGPRRVAGVRRLRTQQPDSVFTLALAPSLPRENAHFHMSLQRPRAWQGPEP